VSESASSCPGVLGRRVPAAAPRGLDTLLLLRCSSWRRARMRSSTASPVDQPSVGGYWSVASGVGIQPCRHRGCRHLGSRSARWFTPVATSSGRSKRQGLPLWLTVFPTKRLILNSTQLTPMINSLGDQGSQVRVLSPRPLRRLNSRIWRFVVHGKAAHAGRESLTRKSALAHQRLPSFGAS
jgi:hypothetical protein